MGFMDKVKGMLGGHADQAEQGVEKGGDALDDRTADKVDKGQDAAKDALRKMDEGGDSGQGTS